MTEVLETGPVPREEPVAEAPETGVEMHGEAAAEGSDTETERVTGPEPSSFQIGDALKSGAAAGAHAAQEMWSTFGQKAGETAYGGAWYLAYGVTFGAMFVGHFIPRDSSFARGLREGREAAHTAYDAWENPPQPAARAPEPAEGEEAPAPAV